MKWVCLSVLCLSAGGGYHQTPCTHRTSWWRPSNNAVSAAWLVFPQLHTVLSRQSWTHSALAQLCAPGGHLRPFPSLGPGAVLHSSCPPPFCPGAPQPLQLSCSPANLVIVGPMTSLYRIETSVRIIPRLGRSYLGMGHFIVCCLKKENARLFCCLSRLPVQHGTWTHNAGLTGVARSIDWARQAPQNACLLSQTITFEMFQSILGIDLLKKLGHLAFHRFSAIFLDDPDFLFCLWGEVFLMQWFGKII